MSKAREIAYGSVRIPYRLIRRQTRKTVGVEVFPDGSVRVLAPTGASTSRIEEILSRKARWITAKRREFSAMSGALIGRVVSGMALRYLGRQYRVRVRRLTSHSGLPVVSISRTGIEIRAAHHVTQKVLDEAVESWLRGQARVVLAERLVACFPPFRRRGYSLPKLALRTMQFRWASLSTQGRITANPRLVHVPLACIDYVLTHELCHLAQPDHGSDFFLELTKRLPNWRALKARLEGQG